MIYQYDDTPSCPTGKPCFKTKAEIRDYIRRRNRRCGGKSFSYYKCSVCGNWHLTTKTVQGDYLLYKHAHHYDRLEKKRMDKVIMRAYDLAV